ncbi:MULTISPECIES: sulfite oxidase [unclassified Streptomyces]|uniref:sulfite oxidase n=1 Tax=unclassified Streptomyces TaxID=2593676 RepID=UPI0015878034|nr:MULTISPECIES: sulfite oxidase [unclassified Streptomyces]NUV70917.1 sulfite oxidase [Streptomyces sp. CAI-121]NUV99138.1 sulfite oxidase [Streptomyces sp. CAI 127]NUW17084.1 sulfite oxidase [Streptomyces sp. CAI-68]
MSPVPTEDVYDRIRMRQWSRGRARSAGIDRRDLLKLVAAASAAVPLASVAAPARAADGLPGVVKPLPAELFTLRGTNAETNFAALRGTGLLTPADRFFVRNHTATPRIDRADWKLTVWGDGLRGGPVEFTYADLRRLPSVTRTAFVECAGNGRSYFTSQQGQTVSGTAWTLGAIGTARWRGVRLADVLRRAGIGRHAVDVLPRGLDAEVVTDGVNLGRVRRPLPVAKALDDVLLAYEMNGEPLPPDHGYPVRLIVPSWVGIANIKWVGDIEVSAEPLLTPWNTGLYRLFGPGHPPEGSPPLTRQSLKSAFELAPGAAFPAHRRALLTGRSWSGGAPVRAVEVSTDGGARWRAARLRDEPRAGSWVRWTADWVPRERGPAVLLARATDRSGRRQPVATAHNTQGYLFDAVVRHPVTVA